MDILYVIGIGFLVIGILILWAYGYKYLSKKFVTLQKDNVYKGIIGVVSILVFLIVIIIFMQI